MHVLHVVVQPEDVQVSECERNAEFYIPSEKKQQGQETERDKPEVNGRKSSKVEHCCYLGNLLNCEAGVERRVRE